MPRLECAREQDHAARRSIVTQLFGRGGDSVWMQPPFFYDYGSNILLGERVFFNFNCVVLDVCRNPGSHACGLEELDPGEEPVLVLLLRK
jgi:hypothetical protein